MKVFLYGIGSASEAYRVHYYRWLEDEEISFLRIRDDAEYMRARNPSIQTESCIPERAGSNSDSLLFAFWGGFSAHF